MIFHHCQMQVQPANPEYWLCVLLTFTPFYLHCFVTLRSFYSITTLSSTVYYLLYTRHNLISNNTFCKLQIASIF